MSTVTILGAGVMGSSMCMPLRDRGHAVRLVGTHLDTEIIDSVKATGRHPKLNVKLPDGVAAYQHQDFAKALGTDTDLILLGISSAGVTSPSSGSRQRTSASHPVIEPSCRSRQGW